MQNSTRIPGENRGRGRSNSRNRGGRGQQGNWRTQREENLGHNEGWLPRGRSPHPRNESSNTENPNNYRRENDRGHRPFRNNNQPNNYSRGQNHQRGDSRENRPPNNDQSNQRKIRQMGFRYLQDLLKKDDLEEIIFTLNNDKRGYKELLESRDMSNDIIVLILQLLCRVCECSFQSSKIQLFESALRSPFSDNVIKFVSTIAIQNEREKRFNSCFWKDTDEFWNNIISLARNLHDLIPTSSCEVMVKLLKAVKLNIPIIETTHSIHISDNIKNDIENLFDLVEKTSKEVERKKELRPQGVDNEDMEPPDDFREISVYPSPLEVTNPKSPFLRPNVTEGPYRDVDHYLDVQFRLLREDFVAPLRKAICRYITNPKDRLEDVKIYRLVRFLNMEIVTEQNCFRIKFDFSNRKKNFQYENSRRFMFGALLCFSSDNFKTVLFGKVVDRDTKYLEKAELIIGFSEDINLSENLYGMDFVMVESTVYFEPYYQVLNVLKTMQFNNFPMERYIINVETTTSPPEYLLGIDPEFYSIEDDRFWPLNWGERRFYGLNDSQSEAFQAALTREFAIIQGPPGTGKTFLGLKIAHTLLNNKDVWYKNTPMLVICFTNHALDQFLEGLLPVTHEVLRVGGQSKNQNLNNFNIRNKRRRMNGNPAVSQKRHEVQNCIREISSINQYLSEIDEKTSVVEFSVFRDVIPNYRGSWFDSAENDDILAWLFSGGEVIHRENRREWQPRELIVDPNNQDNNHGVEGVMADIENDQILDEVFDDIVVHCSNYLITLKSLSDKLNMLAKDLTLLASNDTMNYWEKAHHEDKLNFELYRTESEMDYLRMRLNQFENNIGPPQMVNLMKPQYMSPDDRWQLYFHWLGMFVAMLRQRKETISREFRRIYTVYSEMRDMEDAQIMKGCLVVGMTTTGAARLQASLKTLKSPIVIVEEAAEVLEAHIISSLTSHCKHLILIGDHQQLKPSTANFKIETKFRLGISLFERMVINKIQCHTLNIQHRMRPEISGLIRPTIYPVLEDHESVLNRPQILGIENCVYFLDHKEQEQLCKDNSKKNIHEAKFLIQLARHLILNGYKPENITILAAYLGQMFEMQREKKVYSNLLQDVRIAVLDNYQGEESDIILLSLVRSNSDGKIGFLKTENRVCVALSRARNGFYIMGNLTQLCDNSEIWPKIRDTLKKQDAIGPYLTLRCQVHHHKITQAKKAEDFSTFPEGGCDLMCEAKLGCGHVCKRLCHIEDREHVIYKCREKCVNLLCDDPAHTCLKLCYEDCGACTYLVHRELQCGHSARIACHVDPATHKCMELIHTKLPCEHEAEKPCHMDPNAFRCPHPCDSRVEPCGHACKLSCHIRNDPDHLEYKCTKPCENYREGCTLQNDEAHICPKMCFEECPRCEVFVLKKRTRCNHAFKIPCYLDVDLIECQKSCSKLLPCGHKCLQKCEEPCGDCIKMVEKNVPDCNHKIQIECFKAPNRKYCKGKCPRKLPCGHICTKKCNEDCTTRCKVIVDCSIPSPCGHVMKKIKCFLKDTADPKILLEGCTEKCDFKLKCNHICGGTCGGCSQGRIHQRCTEKCGVPLVCNHECPIPCREACKPCMKPCEYRCKHSKCKRKCGDPCTFCKEPCGRKCKHQNCKKKCGEPCNVPPCDKPCEKKLKCGHPCVGFCGDRCPILCKNCNHEELTDVLLGNEDEENAIYVMLEDCMHTFESGDLERWLRMDENEIKAKVCPRCKTTIKTTSRYSNYIKRTMDDITKVKQKFYGYEKENERARHDIYKEISKLHSRFAMTAGSPHLTSAIDRLKLRLCERRGNRRQNANKMDLEAIKTKMQILDAIYKPFAQQKTEKIRIMHECTKQIAFIVTAVMRDEDSITGQEIEDIMLEIDKLTRYSQFYQINRLPSSSYNNADDVKQQITRITNLLETPGRYTPDSDETLKTELEKLKKLTASGIQLTDAERIQIVKAVGLSKGHWHKCPNGHPYAIGECGGAMQVSKCNECGAPIGGHNHALLPGQSVATEMDGATHAAWSEAANMGNFVF